MKAISAFVVEGQPMDYDDSLLVAGVWFSLEAIPEEYVKYSLYHRVGQKQDYHINEYVWPGGEEPVRRWHRKDGEWFFMPWIEGLYGDPQPRSELT